MSAHPDGTGPASITVLYDARCSLCRRCREWMETQRTWVPVRFLAADSPAARDRRSDLPWLGDDLVVVGENGEVWAGAAAFLVCLWTTVDYRHWSYRMSGPSFAPLAERFFHTVSSNRSRIGAVIGRNGCPDGACTRRVHPRHPVRVAPTPGAPTPAVPMFGPMPPPSQDRPAVNLPPPVPRRLPPPPLPPPPLHHPAPHPSAPHPSAPHPSALPRQPWEPPHPPPPPAGLRWP